MKTLLLLLVLLSAVAHADPIIEHSPDGQYFRIYNPDGRPYYCIVELVGEYPFEKILYSGQFTRWYPATRGFYWYCE
jgi:hypothetical protein